MKRFRDILSSQDSFAFTYELVPSRGSSGAGIDKMLKFAEEATASGMIDALSLTDNAGGGPACSPDDFAREIQAAGMETIVHFAAKDANRNGLEARALSLDRCGLDNLLVLSGDFPINANEGLAKPVFDLDSTQLVNYLRRMNDGLKIAGQEDKFALAEKTDFFMGCAVSSFKSTEPELMNQYYKLEKKILAGAHYVICQLGYDMRKYSELLTYMKERKLTVPAMASVFVLRRGVARVMNRGAVPGCVVTDELVDTLCKEFESPDKGKGAALERTAQQIAMLKGIGYNGAHIEGFGLKFDDVRIVVERSKEIGDNWRDYEEGFRYSPKGSYFVYDKSKQYEEPKAPFRPRRSMLIYSAMKFVHTLFFTKGESFKMKKSVMAKVEKWGLFMKAFHMMENLSKECLFDCRDCGDCALPDMFYLCPESQCPKHQRVGPCGGSHDGICEVHDDRFCVWCDVYMRAKSAGKLDELREKFILPRNWELHNTSSWVNFYLERDHSAGDGN